MRPSEPGLGAYQLRGRVGPTKLARRTRSFSLAGLEPASVKEFAVANSFTSEVRWEGKRKLKRAKEGNGEQRVVFSKENACRIASRGAKT